MLQAVECPWMGQERGHNAIVETEGRTMKVKQYGHRKRERERELSKIQREF